MDTFSPEKRSSIMRRVHSMDTSPEKKVRSLLHRLGFRFRLHRKDLPGRPDIVLPKHKTAIFVHGCFWHRHQGCKRATTPASRQNYWLPKFTRTVERDVRNSEELRRRGWNIIIVWECELRDLGDLENRLQAALCSKRDIYRQDVQVLPLAAEAQKTYRD